MMAGTGVQEKAELEAKDIMEGEWDQEEVDDGNEERERVVSLGARISQEQCLNFFPERREIKSLEVAAVEKWNAQPKVRGM